MVFQHTASTNKEDVDLPDNSMLVFSRDSQCNWKHAIPVEPSITETRYSLTIRNIRPFHVNSTYLYGDSNKPLLKAVFVKGLLVDGVQENKSGQQESITSLVLMKYHLSVI